jgi:hypothetical protein
MRRDRLPLFETLLGNFPNRGVAAERIDGVVKAGANRTLWPIRAIANQ